MARYACVSRGLGARWRGARLKPSATATAGRERRCIRAAATIRGADRRLADAAIVLDREAASSPSTRRRRGRARVCARRAGADLACARRSWSTRSAAPSKRREPQRVEFFERVPLDRWFEAFVTPVRLPAAAQRQADILLMTFNDLTPLRRVEEMRADFIANASHELRTPLAALARLHRDAARPGQERCRRAREIPRPSCSSRRPAWRG